MSRARPLRRLLSAVLLLLALTPAGAVAAPNITLNVNAPKQVLLGRDATVNLTASNPAGQPYGYNLSFRDVLPAGISYVAGSASFAGSPVEPTVIANQPAVGQTTLLWRNVGDLSPNSSGTLTYKVRHATTGVNARTVGDSYSHAASAYINTNPRTVPAFTAAGVYSSGSTGTASGTATTTLSAISMDVQEGSPEGELLRGAHDHQTVYTLHLENNAVGPTGPLTVDTYLPAGLEFLGCGNVDNTTNAPTNPASTAEYPGAGALSGHTAAPAGCTLPTAVTTETVDPDGSGPLPSAVYTHLRWTGLPALAANATRDLRYVAAVPMRENTAPFSAANQTANLDNNAGPRTQDEQPLSTYAKVTGNYGAIPATADDTETRTAEDLRILKSNGGQGTINDGQLTRWTLTLDTGEYRFVDNLRVTDTVPDGLCPLDTINRESDQTADCAPGPAPSFPYTSATEQVNGTWTLTWNSSTDPELVRMDPSTTRTIAFSTRSRPSYQENFVDDKPVLANDRWANSVAVLGADYQRRVNGTPIDPGSLLPPETDPDGTDDGDVSSSEQSAEAPRIDKQIRASANGAAVPADCSGGTYAKAPTALYGPGDRVCYKLRVDFPSLLDTGRPAVTDFLPPGVTYESSRPTAANTVTIQSTNGAVGDPVVSFTLGNGPGNATNGDVFEVLVAGRVTDATAGAAADVKGNLMKVAFTDSAGRSYPLRDQADLTWAEAQLTLLEGVQQVNSGTVNGPNVDGVTVRPGDAVTIRVDVTNTGNRDARAATVLERLPVGVSCADVAAGSISDGGTCAAGVITWTGVDVPASAAKKLTYRYTVPSGGRPGTVFTHTAGVRDYQSLTNAGAPFTYFPASNIDPSVTVTNAGAAKDPTNVRLADPTVTYTSTSNDISQSGNNSAQATIGERITYTATASIPNGELLQNTAGPATFTIPVGAKQTLLGAPAITLNGSPLPAGFTVTTTGNTIKVTFPANYLAPGTGTDVLQVVYRATVDNVAANTRQTGSQSITTTATLAYADPTGAAKTQSASTTQTIVEPNLTLVKSNSDADGRVSPGQRYTYTVRVTNPSTPGGVSTANDVVITDQVPVGLTPVTAAGNPVANGGAVQPTTSGIWNAATRTITFPLATVTPNSTTDLRYEVRVDSPAIGNAVKTNTAQADSTSYPATATLYGTERTATANAGTTYYRTTASNTVTLSGADLAKSVDAATATIGQTRTFTLDATLPANLDLYDVTVRDLLPDGMDYETGSATATCVGGCALTAAPLPVTDNADGSTLLGFFIGDVSNAPADRVVRITYRAHVDDRYEPEGTAVVRPNVLTNTAAVFSNQTNVIVGTPATTPPTSSFSDRSADRTSAVRVVEPVLSVVKQASRAAAQPGDTLTYTVKVSNTGDADAYEVSVTDQPDSELVDVTPASGVSTTALTDGWTAADPDLAWTIPTIAAGGSVTLTYTAKLGPSSGLRESDRALNTAEVPTAYGRPAAERLAHPTFDYRTYTGGLSRVSVEIDLPRVAVSLTTGAAGFPESAPAEVGQSFPWRAVVSNSSPTATAYGADLTVRLPVGWTYDPGSAPVGDPAIVSDPVNGDLLTWTDVADLAPGGSKVVTFSATPGLSARNQANPQIARASVTAEDASGATGSADGPYAAGPDPAQATLLTPQLTLVKTPDDGRVTAGTTGTWTIRVGNTGSGTARTVRVTDVLPAGVQYTAGSAGELSNTLNRDGTRTLVFAVADLAPGASATISLSVRVPASDADGTRYVNSASVGAAEQPDGPDDEGSFDVDTAADVRVTKVADSARFVAGRGVSWTVTATNDGPSDAANVVVTDDLPATVSGVTLSGADAGDCAVSAGSLRCDFGTLAPDATRSVVVSGTLAANATGSLVNAAHVDTDTPDPTAGNDDDTSTTPVDEQADLELIKTASVPATVQTGLVTYTLRVENKGPSVARATTITDDLPAGMSYVSDDAGCTHATGTVRCDLGTLAAGAVRTVKITARAVTTGTKRNTASVTTTATDPVPGNNSDDADVDVGPAIDLRLDKRGPATVAAGAQATFALEITNDGPADATGVRITDTLPGGLTYVSDDGGCAHASGVITCPVGALAAGASTTVSVVVRATYAAADQTLTNRATTTADQSELDPDNNDDSADITVGPSADVRIAKTVDPAAVPQGQTAAYTLRVDNDGPSEAKATEITDALPSGVSFVSAPGCTEAAGTVTCALGDLPANGFRTVTITVRGEATGTHTNTATVSSTTPDQDASNNESSADLGVGPTADLAVVKAGPATVGAGYTVTYDLSVTNNGPSDATDVRLTDTLPTGMTFVAATEEQGSHTVVGRTITFALGTVPSGATVRATVTARAGFAVAGTTVINSATAAATEFDPEPTDNTDEHPVTVGSAADVSVVKTAPAAVPAGGTIVYALQVANAGPQAATNVSLQDPLPAGLTLVSATPSQGSCGLSGTTLRCSLGTLAAGAGAQVLLAARVDAGRAGTDVRNAATVRADQPDPATANNADDAVTRIVVPPATPPGAPDLRVDKTLDPGRVLVGRRHGFTITVTNRSDVTAKGVVVLDQPASTMDLVAMTTSQGSCSVKRKRCSVGDVAGGATVRVHVVAIPRSAGAIANSASVLSDSGDSAAESNSDSVKGRARAPRTRFKLRKRAMKRSVAAGAKVRYVLRVQNVGGAMATRVRVCDIPPPGMTFVRVPGARLSKGRACWTVSSWKAGAKRSFRVVARVNRTRRGRMVNRATLTAANAKRRRAAVAVRVRAAAPGLGGGVTG